MRAKATAAGLAAVLALYGGESAWLAGVVTVIAGGAAVFMAGQGDSDASLTDRVKTEHRTRNICASLVTNTQPE